MMMVKNPKIQIRIVSNIENHLRIQTRVMMVEEEDVEDATRLLLRVNKWAKPLPKLDLPPRIHLQKASKVKQIWELCSVNVALAMVHME